MSTETTSSERAQPDAADVAPPFRYNAALATEIELRWQDRWDADHTFETPNPVGDLADPGKLAAAGDKLFILDMFPYPSDYGLHVGHPLGFIGTDVYARYQRMAGRNVLYTDGLRRLRTARRAVRRADRPAPGRHDGRQRRQLPQTAAPAGDEPRLATLGGDDRSPLLQVDPMDLRPHLRLVVRPRTPRRPTAVSGRARPIAELVAEYEAGSRPTPDGRAWSSLSDAERAAVIDPQRLAYVAEAPVNWCPGLGTVVANEEVTADGRSDRGNFPVFKRTMRQWMMRITAYADRLLDDLDRLDWTDALKTMQRNWIGRSTGARIDFDSPAGPIAVFTTRPDTLFGATFMVLAPEHPLVPELTTSQQAAEVVEYRKAAAAFKETERLDDERAKSGVFTGSYATNPATGQDIPIWIADYVLMGYGTGAIMAVPCGDQRDFEFATVYGLDIPAIQRPPDEWFAAHHIKPTLDTRYWPEAFVGDAPYVNSSNNEVSLDGITSVDEGIATINEWLESVGAGEATITYKLRDWLFARQRYWGEPIPIVYDAAGNPHVLPDEMLPLTLPDTDEFAPRSFDPDDEFSEPESPLDRVTEWVEVTLDLGDGQQTYRRDTNVMPQWAGSCWYELRYCDPTNDEALVDPVNERYWMGPRTDVRPDHPGGVDLYVGGVEHAVLHLLYARFWHKVLFDLGYLSSSEPFARLFNQGYVLAAAFEDERGIYVPADDVVVDDDGNPTYDGSRSPVTGERWARASRTRCRPSRSTTPTAPTRCDCI